MKKFNILVLATALSLSACSYDTAELEAGGTLTDPANSDSLPTIHFRINQAAIDQHALLATLSSLKTFEEEKVPTNWPASQVEKVRNAFLYLHNESTPEQFSSFSSQILGDKTIVVFKYDDSPDFALVTSKDVSALNWETLNGDKVVMTKASEDVWEIKVEGEVLTWTVSAGKLCFESECVDI